MGSVEAGGASTPRAIHVEVVYSPVAREVVCVPLTLAEGSSAQAAVAASGLGQRFPEVLGDTVAWSVWGKRCAPEQSLRDHDRVEICRPLKVDPKEARRLRYREQRVSNEKNTKEKVSKPRA